MLIKSKKAEKTRNACCAICTYFLLLVSSRPDRLKDEQDCGFRLAVYITAAGRGFCWTGSM
jgi:hypothetical protein